MSSHWLVHRPGRGAQGGAGAGGGHWACQHLQIRARDTKLLAWVIRTVLLQFMNSTKDKRTMLQYLYSDFNSAVNSRNSFLHKQRNAPTWSKRQITLNY